MKVSTVAAGISGLLVLLWLLSTMDTIGTPHELYYFDIPIAFLVVPVAVIAFNCSVRKRISANFDEFVGGISGIAILVNLFVFCWYAAMSGGGV